jgi:membrane-associated phospholipid phosphatase
MNKFHTAFFDWFFRIITYLGDGVVVLIIGFLILFISFRLSAYLISTYAATGIVVQLLKNLFFYDFLRPVEYFKNITELYLIEGIKLYHHHSFPSGHAASAFGLFLCLALSTHKKTIHFICFLLASATAYSRVYLSQHFLIDIFFGAIIGITGAIGFYYVFYRKERNWYKLSLITLWQK